MRLERSTYVKIALIVLLCLGVCGFFGGCGRGVVVAPLGSLLAPGGLMGCVGWNAMGEIAGYAGDAVGEMAGYFWSYRPIPRWRRRWIKPLGTSRTTSPVPLEIRRTPAISPSTS